MTREDPSGLVMSAVQPWLGEHISGLDVSEPLAVRLLAGGRSNLTYEFTDPRGRRIALRRQPLGHVMPSAHDMQREFTVMSGLGSVGYPVPPALAMCQDESVIGVPFMVTEFVDGRVIADAAGASSLDAVEADGISGALVDGLAALHAVDAGAAGLQDLGRPQGYLQRQVARWAKQWSLTKTRELAAVEELQAWLADAVAAIPDDLPWSIVHGDYRIDNLILDPRESRILAVVDWEMATLGDPVADLAVSLVYWSEAGDGLRARLPVAQGVTTNSGFWSRERFVERYATVTGRDLSHLDACVALACFKLAVIMESIHFRNLAGQQLGAASENHEDMALATEVLVEIGLRATRLGGIEALRS